MNFGAGAVTSFVYKTDTQKKRLVRKKEILVSAALRPDQNIISSVGNFILVSEMKEEGGMKQVQGRIWQLQDEVRVLQEELERTRRALDQRASLLRNAQQRELELRAEVGAGGR